MQWRTGMRMVSMKNQLFPTLWHRGSTRGTSRAFHRSMGTGTRHGANASPSRPDNRGLCNDFPSQFYQRGLSDRPRQRARRPAVGGAPQGWGAAYAVFTLHHHGWFSKSPQCGDSDRSSADLIYPGQTTHQQERLDHGRDDEPSGNAVPCHVPWGDHAFGGNQRCHGDEHVHERADADGQQYEQWERPRASHLCQGEVGGEIRTCPRCPSASQSSLILR